MKKIQKYIKLKILITIIIPIILILFFDSILIIAQDNYADQPIIISLEQLIDYAKSSNSELQTLKYSLNQLIKAKADLYKNLVPAISIGITSGESTNLDSADSNSYSTNITFNQILYEQASFELKLLQYKLSIQEASMKIQKKEKEIERSCMNLYLSILMMDEKIKSKNMEIEIYKKLLFLLEEEIKLGSKKLIDLYEGQQRLLQSQIDLEQLISEKQLALQDLYEILQETNKKRPIIFEDDLDSFFQRVLFLSSGHEVDIDFFLNKLLVLKDYRNQLLTCALNSNLDLKMLNVKILEIKAKLELLKLLFLKNISISFDIKISGTSFPPLNIDTTFKIGISIDFSIFSGSTSVNIDESQTSTSASVESSASGPNTLVLPDTERQLLIELKSADQKIKDTNSSIEKSIDNLLIQSNVQIKKYFLKKSQIEIMEKKKEIIETQLKIGEIKEVDYFDFIKELNSAYLELKEAKNAMLNIIFSLVDLTNMSVEEIFLLLSVK
jgi:outer membrane protein TolC